MATVPASTSAPTPVPTPSQAAGHTAVPAPVARPEPVPAKAPRRWQKLVTPILVVLLAAAVVATVTRNWNAWEGGRIEQTWMQGPWPSSISFNSCSWISNCDTFQSKCLHNRLRYDCVVKHLKAQKRLIHYAFENAGL